MDKDWEENIANATMLMDKGKDLYDELVSLRPENTDIIICPAHLGDTVWIAALAGSYIAQHDCEQVYYVVTKSQNDMVNMFPDIAGTIALTSEEMQLLRMYISYKKWLKHDHIILAHFNAFIALDPPSLRMVEYPMQGAMIKTRKEMMDLSGEATFSRMNQLPVDNPDLKEMFENAVLLMPVAQSVNWAPQDFFARLAKRYKELGYKVYTNYNGFKYEYVVDGTDPLSSSIMELYELGPYFAQVVAMRSGSCDLLTENDTNLSVLYVNKVAKPKVVLDKDELYPDSIFDLVDREGLVNYQHIDGMDEELIEALVKQARELK